jgi:hypothetical protein
MGVLRRGFRTDAESRLQELHGQVRRPCHPLAFSKAQSPLTYRFQRPDKYVLILNLKTAKALGLTIPESFLQRADEVIE